MSDDVESVDNSVNESVDNSVDTNTDSPAAEEKHEFVLDKYRADGRSEHEALMLQAKSYTDLQSRFGSFTGAPDEYTTELSDELVEAGVELIADDPLMADAMEYAKAANMSQEGFNDLVDLYAKTQLAEHQAKEQQRAEEMKALGSNASQRIEAVNAWASANLDAQTLEGLQGVIQTADGFKAVEQLISMTKAAPVAPDATAPAPSISADEVHAMAQEKDAHGNRRINTDPEFKKEYWKKMNELHPGAHRQMVG